MDIVFGDFVLYYICLVSLESALYLQYFCLKYESILCPMRECAALCMQTDSEVNYDALIPSPSNPNVPKGILLGFGLLSDGAILVWIAIAGYCASLAMTGFCASRRNAQYKSNFVWSQRVLSLVRIYVEMIYYFILCLCGVYVFQDYYTRFQYEKLMDCSTVQSNVGESTNTKKDWFVT